MTQNSIGDSDLYILVFATTAFFLILAGFIVYFIVLYQKKQIQNQLEQENMRSKFRQEFLKARIETQEETFNYVSRELHDNITQVLSFVKLNMAMIPVTDDQHRKKINENRDLISQTITDLRDLSKSLSFEYITTRGLFKTIENEVEKINKSGLVQVEFTLDGDAYSLGEQRELVLFRIFQEALNNSFKHSSCKVLKIALNYHPELFNLTVGDDGVGFLANSLTDSGGSGLKNIDNRANLIGAVATIESSPGNGCVINIALNPLEQSLYADGNHPDRLSR
jgi:signal transduction histidine kinase